MRSINALSLAPAVNDWLTNSRQPSILHVFDRACNLINEHREVLSIVTQDIGKGPFNLVISGLRKHRPRLRRDLRRGRAKRGMATSFEGLLEGDETWQISEVFKTINLQSPVSISTMQLSLGDLNIDITKAELWNPRPDWEMLHGKRESILHQLTQLLISNECEASQWGQFPSSLVSRLSRALVTADIAIAKAIASQFAGLGVGLTPAGDDYMLGAIYATLIIHPIGVARVLVEEIAKTASPLTTSLSAAWLRSAGRGEAGILWHQFFAALNSVDPAQIQEAMDNILAVGETSGTDALEGFLGLFIEWRGYCLNL